MYLKNSKFSTPNRDYLSRFCDSELEKLLTHSGAHSALEFIVPMLVWGLGFVGEMGGIHHSHLLGLIYTNLHIPFPKELLGLRI